MELMDVDKFKARCVARGFSQKEGVDYNEIFALVARYTTIHSIIALATSQGWNLHQMDVKTAFLHGSIKEEVYVEQPKGFKVQDRQTHICRVKKALYGLKQAPRAWCRPSHSSMQEESASEFEMKDLGLMHYFLGLEVWKKPSEIFLFQGKYIVKLLERFGMVDYKFVTTPMELNFKKLYESVVGPDLGNPFEYRQLVGALMFLVNSRPDICFAVNTLSQLVVELHHIHWIAAKNLLRYLWGTITYGLRYTVGNVRFHDYSDEGSVVDHKSTSGCCFSLGSTSISWISRKQKSVSLSTVEAEYIAASMASCEIVWLRKLFSELFRHVLDITMIFCDNQSGIRLSDIRYHFIWDMVQQGAIRLCHIGTDDQVADILTKPLWKVKFLTFREQLELVERPSNEGLVRFGY
eukprot:PITA_01650